MFSTPGVYIEEESSLSLAIHAGTTAVPVIVGTFRDKEGTVRSLAQGCVRVANWMDFESKFHTNPCTVRVAVEYLEEAPPEEIPENGSAKPGVTARRTVDYDSGEYYFTISEIGSDGDSVLAIRHYFDNGGGPFYLLSYDPDHIEDELQYVSEIPSWIKQYPEISLLVLAESNPGMSGNMYWPLCLVFHELQKTDYSYFFIAHGRDADNTDDKPPTKPDQTGFYAPYVRVSYRYWRLDDQVEIAGYLDGEEDEKGEVVNLSQLEARNPALYKAICSDVDQRLAGWAVQLPPSAAVAGAYARSDRERGVWKAPANIALRSVSSVSKAIEDDEHGQLNDAGVNVIRWQADRGAVIAGARTLEVGAGAEATDWRYISVRRLFGAVERDVRHALRPLVFEPNNSPTWERARAAIANHLRDLWRQGALMGDTEAQAYFVRVGKGLTMTDDDIVDGKLILRIGMAAVRPAEFIVLEFTQRVGQV